MTDAPPVARHPPRFQLIVLVILLFAFQLAMIFWLARRPAEKPAPPLPVTQVLLPASTGPAWVGADDPTLFVLPNPRGFSGPAWMNRPAVMDEYQPMAKPGPPSPLPLPVQQLGASVGGMAQKILPQPFLLPDRREPTLERFNLPPAASFLPVQTTVTIQGDLARRPLLSAFNPASWTSARLLSNTVVQIAVDREGRVFSPALLATCGSPPADADAVAQARAVLFQPLPAGQSRDAAPDFTWGRLVFHWHTLPPPATNAVPPGGS